MKKVSLKALVGTLVVSVLTVQQALAARNGIYGEEEEMDAAEAMSGLEFPWNVLGILGAVLFLFGLSQKNNTLKYTLCIIGVIMSMELLLALFYIFTKLLTVVIIGGVVVLALYTWAKSP